MRLVVECGIDKDAVILGPSLTTIEILDTEKISEELTKVTVGVGIPDGYPIKFYLYNELRNATYEDEEKVICASLEVIEKESKGFSRKTVADAVGESDCWNLW